MARWMLLEPHYLSSPESYWEQRETDRETGRQKIKKYPTPMHLDPRDPGHWNYKSGDRDISQGGSAFIEGCIIVCREGKGEPKDIVFTGDVTPGMKPLDPEAEAESEDAKILFKWESGERFIDQTETYSERVLRELASKANEPSPDMKAVLAAVNQVLEQNSKLMAQLSARRS